jgi:hypothetical protein
LQGVRALDALDLCLDDTRTLTTNSLGGALLTDGDNLTGTLQGNVSFKLLLGSFKLVKSTTVPRLQIHAGRKHRDGSQG